MIKNDIRRWMAENVKSIYIDQSTFKHNKNGFPILNEDLNLILLTFFKYNLKITLK